MHPPVVQNRALDSTQRASANRARVLIALLVASLVLLVIHNALWKIVPPSLHTSNVLLSGLGVIESILRIAEMFAFFAWARSAWQTATTFGRPVAADVPSLAGTLLGVSLGSWLLNSLIRYVLHFYGSAFHLLTGLVSLVLAFTAMAVEWSILSRLASASDPSPMAPVTVATANPQAHFREGAQVEQTVSGRVLTPPVALWFGLALTLNVTYAFNLIAMPAVLSHVSMESYAWVFVVSAVLRLVVTVALVVVLYAIDARQREQLRRLAALWQRG